MKKGEIENGGRYTARISNRLVTVRVEEIFVRDGRGYTQDRTHYRCTNLVTGREVTIRSAAKFRSRVEDTQPIQFREKIGSGKYRCARCGVETVYVDEMVYHERMNSGHNHYLLEE